MADALPVAHENAAHDPDGAAFMEQTFTPSEGRLVGMSAGGSEVQAGVYQLLIKMPKGDGWGDAVDEVARIREHFTAEPILNEGTTRIIIERVWRSPSLPDDVYYKIPVSVRVRAI